MDSSSATLQLITKHVESHLDWAPDLARGITAAGGKAPKTGGKGMGDLPYD